MKYMYVSALDCTFVVNGNIEMPLTGLTTEFDGSSKRHDRPTSVNNRHIFIF